MWYIVSLLEIMKELFLYPLQVSHEGVWYSYTMAVGSFYWAYLTWNNTLDQSSCLRMSVFHSVYLWVWISHDGEPLILSTQVINRLLVRSFLVESLICIMRVVKKRRCWVYYMMQYVEYTARVVAVYVRTPLMYGSYVKKPMPNLWFS